MNRIEYISSRITRYAYNEQPMDLYMLRALYESLLMQGYSWSRIVLFAQRSLGLPPSTTLETVKYLDSVMLKQLESVLI